MTEEQISDLVLVLTGCNSQKAAQKKLNKIFEKHPELLYSDTSYVIKEDTILVPVPTIKFKAEVEAYNTLVTQGEGYDGVKTIKWANVIKHPDREEYAILANSKYESETLSKLDQLTSDWFSEIIE